jgi:predicted DCC family thiol-disulfide oxidoreductase YuxK
LTRQEVGRAAWAVEASGRRFEGAAALNRVLRELGGVWALLGHLYDVPPIASLENHYYKRVALKRSWF